MIPKELEAKILRLYHTEKWKVGTIARQLGIHHNTVERVLSQANAPFVKRTVRPSMVDPYMSFVLETLEEYPTLAASRLFEMIKERGYPGGPDHFRSIVAKHRPRPPAEAYLRLRTLPGEQAQVDWGGFGNIQFGKASRRLSAFVLVLSWSRQIFVRFFINQRMSSFLQGHVEAFQFLGGVPRVLLYDNLKSAVLERVGDAIRFHPILLDFAAHYRYEPRPVPIRRPCEKGRVERAIRYIRGAFFAARNWIDIDDLNAQVLAWCKEPAGQRRCPEDKEITVQEAFQEEKAFLLALPDNPFPVDDKEEVSVGKTPYVRFDLNDYSVPYRLTQRILVVMADEKTVRVLEGNEVVAEHKRSYDKGQQIEDPAHIEELIQQKRQARKHRGMDRLYHAAPSSRDLLSVTAKRGGNLGSVTAGLLRLLDRFGSQELELSIAEALEKDSPHIAAVRQILDRRLHERKAPPPIAVELPEDSRVRNVIVKPHSLKSYDSIRKEASDER
jgi:transposase